MPITTRQLSDAARVEVRKLIRDEQDHLPPGHPGRVALDRLVAELVQRRQGIADLRVGVTMHSCPICAGFTPEHGQVRVAEGWVLCLFDNVVIGDVSNLVERPDHGALDGVVAIAGVYPSSEAFQRYLASREGGRLVFGSFDRPPGVGAVERPSPRIKKRLEIPLGK